MRKRGSLLGTIARTAVITGTAKAVLGRGNRAAAPAGPEVAAPAAAAGGVSTEDRIAALTQLGELRKAGVLTEEEFAAEKAKILNG